MKIRYVFSKDAIKDLQKLTTLDCTTIVNKLIQIQFTDTILEKSKKLAGGQNRFRIRIGKFRIIGRIEIGIFHILRIIHRKDVYKKVN